MLFFPISIPITDLKENPLGSKRNINKWALIGPFPVIQSPDKNQLLFEFDDYFDLETKNRKGLNQLRIKSTNKDYEIVSDSAGFFDLKGVLNETQSVKNETIIFFYSKVFCLRKEDLYLALIGMGNYRIWINDTLVLEKPWTHSTYAVPQFQFMKKIISGH